MLLVYNDIKGCGFVSNKNIFSSNLKWYMALNEKSRKDLATDLDISYYTVTDWVNGKKYPRMDKVEKLAQYFGISKSDLIEEKTEEQREMQKKNDIQADIILKMRTDTDFMSVVETLYKLDKDKLQSINQMLNTLFK